LKTEIDKLQIEKQQMSQLQEQVLTRIKEDIEIKTNNQEENLLNTRLQQSVEELNVIIRHFSSRKSSFLVFSQL
jgi:hypothetical protein